MQVIDGAAKGNMDLAAPGPMPHDTSQLHDVALRLCEEGEFQQALAPAMVLALWHPESARFAFIAGTCLQRIGQPAAALAMFGRSGLASAEKFAAVASFRAGECLAAMGRTPEAIHAFEAAMEASRQNASLAELQDLARNKAQVLRAH
jgi:tetratricopeptide (TPR) repeat protein